MLKVRLLIISQPFLYLTAHSCHFPPVVMSTASYLFWFSPLYLCFCTAELSLRDPAAPATGKRGPCRRVENLEGCSALVPKKSTAEFHFAQSIKRIFFPFLGLDRRDQRGNRHIFCAPVTLAPPPHPPLLFISRPLGFCSRP